ncbi:MAG: hypothetical protein DRH12_02485 [Deltaproteobacteria bacterium]|nr:MAG: hypothetical protein DRH12_02485 [Deltaproteobacteria bacterium]
MAVRIKQKSPRKELFEKVIDVYPTLSSKKRRIADFILKDYKKLFLMTAKEIADECNVSEPTVIRFTQDLGFSGYSEFVQYIKGLLRIELTSVERLTKTKHKSKDESTLKRYCDNAMGNLEHLLNSVSEFELKRIAKTIYEADQVYVVGYRASATLAYYFGYLLKKIRDNVLIDMDISWETIDLITKDDKMSLMCVFAFPRYPRRTIELVKFAKGYGIKILGISDNPRSPIVTLSDEYVIIDVEGVSFIDPFSHIITFISALVHEITFIDSDKAKELLAKFDEGVKASKEFYTEEGINDELEYKLDGDHLTSLWPQKKGDL